MRKIQGSMLMLGVFALALSLLASGCDKPTAEMKRAENAISAAEDAGAKEYAAKKLASAEEAMRDGKKYMDSWQYKQARDEFEKAYRFAREAKEMALNADRGGEPPPVVDYIKPPPPPSVGSHTVVSGECLWWIAEGSDVYSDPFQWPLIYDANRDEIDAAAKSSGLGYMRSDGWAHWIFPGQEFDIPSDVSTEDIKNARSRAGAPQPYRQ